MFSFRYILLSPCFCVMMTVLVSAQLPEFRITNPWKDFLGCSCKTIHFDLVWRLGTRGYNSVCTVSVVSTSSSSQTSSSNTQSVTSFTSGALTTTSPTNVKLSSSANSQIPASTSSGSQATDSAAVPLIPVSKNLSTGAKAGIAVGSILGVVAIASIMLCVFFFGRRTAGRKKEDISPEDLVTTLEEGEGASSRKRKRVSELGDGVVKGQRLSELGGSSVKIQRFSELDSGVCDGMQLKWDQVAELEGSVVPSGHKEDQGVGGRIVEKESEHEQGNETQIVGFGEGKRERQVASYEPSDS
ncbi:hypothetical protein BGZ60DRAFT_432969 [Tricladium varicosporioides]|nr:hypothetical protein BGZ60DRAFT_432969 [Hymenoscyphus varicosporioides]